MLSEGSGSLYVTNINDPITTSLPSVAYDGGRN